MSSREGFWPESVRKKAARSQFCIFKNVVRDAARVHGGALEEFERGVRAGPDTGSERGVPTPLTVPSILTDAR
jgi:hypothetical protein